MEIVQTDLDGVLIVKPKLFGDARGEILETYHAVRYGRSGIAPTFVQDNVSISQHSVLRGLHFQHPHGQAKLVQVLEGEVYDVAVDIRWGSPQFGHWVGTHLNGREHHQMFIPAGFALGFAVLSEIAIVSYKCSDFYQPDCATSVLWNDPDIGIDWPVNDPILSERDAEAIPLSRFDPADLPHYPAADSNQID